MLKRTPNAKLTSSRTPSRSSSSYLLCAPVSKTSTQRTIQSFLFHPVYTVRITLRHQPWWPTTSSCNTPCTQDHAFKDLFNAEIKKPTANPSSRTLSTTDCLVSRVPSSRAAGGNYPKSTSRQYLLASFLTLFSPTSTIP